MADQPLVLGIETSCDETGAGLVRGHELLADAIASSVAEHARFGGVVPEIAARAHVSALVPCVREAMGKIVATCQKHNVPVGHPHVDSANVERVVADEIGRAHV